MEAHLGAAEPMTILRSALSMALPWHAPVPGGVSPCTHPPCEACHPLVLNPKPHLVALDLDHREDDVVVDDDALALLAWDDDHG